MNSIYEVKGLAKDIKLNKDKVFEEIVEEYSNSVLRVCYLQTGEFHESEDLTQEVFMKVYKSIEKFKGEASLYTWIYRITINTCLSYLKKKGKIIYEELDENLSEGEDLESVVIEKYSKKELRDILFKIPNKYRLPLYMYYFEEMKIAQIAEVLEINENTIKTRIKRGKEFIKKSSGGEKGGR